MKYQTRILACSLFFLSPAISLAGKKSIPHQQQSPTAISSDAAAFLDNAIDIMRQHALHGQGVDWVALRTEAFKRAGGAFNPIDTYPAIYWALVQLGDSGSHLRLPPGLYPDQIALMQQAEKEAQENAPAAARTEALAPTAFTMRRIPEGHVITLQGNNFGYIVLPRCSAKDNDGLMLYAADVRRILSDLSAQNPRGWIVDLRGNTGGNMWPMLTGIGPILGDGVVGSFVAADGNVNWFYQDGKTGTRNPAGVETVSLNLDEAPVLSGVNATVPVAILTDSSTASSAEAITIAFHGRANTRFFGSHTAGKSTAVQPYQLDDGAELYLTTAIDADRSGKPYPDGFTPDEVFPSVATMPAESSDPVVHAAELWLAGTTPASTAPLRNAKSRARSRHKAAPAVLAAAPTPAATPVAPATAAIAAPAAAATTASAPAASPATTTAAVPAPAASIAAPMTAAPAATASAISPAAPPAPAPVKRKKVVVHEGS